MSSSVRTTDALKRTSDHDTASSLFIVTTTTLSVAVILLAIMISYCAVKCSESYLHRPWKNDRKRRSTIADILITHFMPPKMRHSTEDRGFLAYNDFKEHEQTDVANETEHGNPEPNAAA